jgi:hypothetical protein
MRCKIELLDLLYHDMHTGVSTCERVGRRADHDMTRKNDRRPNVPMRSPQKPGVPFKDGGA